MILVNNFAVTFWEKKSHGCILAFCKKSGFFVCVSTVCIAKNGYLKNEKECFYGRSILYDEKGVRRSG